MTDFDEFESGIRITTLMIFCLFFVLGWFYWWLWAMGAVIVFSFLITPTGIGPYIEID